SGDKFTGLFNTRNNIAPPSSFVTGIGRMYNLPYDVVVTVVAGGIFNGTNNQLFPNGTGGQPEQNVIAKADFTRDGFDDFAFISENGTINIFTAADVNDMNQGFFYANPTPLPANTVVNQYKIAAGDFDGSGVNELAVASVLYSQAGVQIGIQI